MCFSAPASFAVATGTGLVGVAAATKVSNWREVPLASVPLIFAAQQAVEGVLWLLLARGDQASSVAVLANIFAFCALAVWPLWAPLAAGLVERDHLRRIAIAALFVLAVPVAVVGLKDIYTNPYGACVLQHSISYTNGTIYSPLELGTYFLCVCGPLFLSSHKMLNLFGAIVVVGLGVSAIFFFATSFSVWCFFAAAGSITVYLYFASAREHGSDAQPA